MKLGYKIYDLRHERKLTQVVLADRAGISPTAVHQYEHSKYNPTLQIMFRLCQVFGITVSELLEGVDEL
jgi:transcriptional regulator with XRE-family HTH domain